MSDVPTADPVLDSAYERLQRVERFVRDRIHSMEVDSQYAWAVSSELEDVLKMIMNGKLR